MLQLHRAVGVSLFRAVPAAAFARFASGDAKPPNRFAEKYQAQPRAGPRSNAATPKERTNEPKDFRRDFKRDFKNDGARGSARAGDPAGPGGKHGGKPRAGHGHGGAPRPAPPGRFQPRFENHTGTERARAAVAQIVERARKYNAALAVEYVDPESGKVAQCHLSRVVNALDLAEHGLLLVGPKEGGDVPLVRRISSAAMLKAFSDALAAAKQRELAQQEGTRASYLASRRAAAERKKSAVKTLVLAWSISVSDLNNQKKHEIVNRLKKDDKFVIHIEDKGFRRRPVAKDDDSEPAPSSKLSRMDAEALDIEMMKRQRLFDSVSAILDECNCKVEATGTLESRMILKVASRQPHKTPAANHSSMDQVDDKELKRRRKAERAREQKQTIDEDDLDSLYSFKIEE